MATRDEVIQAIRNADAAGDSASVRKLGAFLQSMPADSTPAEAAREQTGSIAAIGAGLGKGVGQVALNAQNLVGGGISALGGIGQQKTLTDLIVPNQGNPIQRAGQWLQNDAKSGLSKIEGEAAPYKEDHPYFEGGGELAGNVLATLPVGGVLAKGVAAIPGVAARAPGLVNAIGSAGMTTGTKGGNAIANLATRVAGGAVTGGASAELVSPDSGATGALIGGALPPGLQVGGVVGRWLVQSSAGQAVANAFRTSGEKGARSALQALGMQDRADELLGYLRSGSTEFVQGSKPTVAQSLVGTPLENKAGIYERVVSKSPGADKLLDVYGAQNAARKNALEAVAPTNALGLAQARDDLGNSIARYAIPEEKKLFDYSTQAYKAVDPSGQSAIGLPLKDFEGAMVEHLGPGTVGQGEKARAVMGAANRIGTIELPAVDAAKAGKQQSMLDAVKAAGGISKNSISSQMFGDELKDLQQSGLGRVVYNQRGMTLDRMTERMYQAGFIADEDPALLLDLLRNNGKTTFSAGENMGGRFQAMADEAAGGVPGAETIPRQVPFSEARSLRTSINDALTEALGKGRTKEAAALGAMKRSLDETVMNAAIGKGQPGDVMPPGVVERFLEANKSYSELMGRFHTGPQAGIFSKGGDGQPMKQGGEIASAFWGARPGQAEDVKSFRRLVDESPALLGQFKSMLTTEGLSTQTKTGQELSAKFPQWVSQHMPGLREALSSEELDSIQRIAQDIQRAQKAAVAGKGPGATSDTYQLGANALSQGFLGSPTAKIVAGKVPYGNSLREFAAQRTGISRAKNAASFLSDSEQAQTQLRDLLAKASKNPDQTSELRDLLGMTALRAAPVAGSGR